MPTIIHGLPNADYHAMPAASSSGLKLVRRSPRHYWAKYRDPNRKHTEPTPLMRIGTAWHCALFEPERFAEEYIEVPEGLDKRTKEGKALFAEIEASGKEPASAEFMERIRFMEAASRSYPVMRVLFGQRGISEASFFWTDAQTGMECKARPDYHIPPCDMFPNGFILDGKSTDDASGVEFGKDAWNAAHYIQASYYCDGFMAVYGTSEPPIFGWLAQERDVPYCSAFYTAPASMLDYGRKLYHEGLEVIAQCEASGVWPGYSEQSRELIVPAWAQREIDGEGDDDMEVIGYV